MPVNLGNSLWAKRMAMQQQQLAQKKADMQHAQAIAAKGAQDVTRIQQQAYTEGLRAAREAGQAAALTGQPTPQYEQPNLQHAAETGALLTRGKQDAEQRKNALQMLRDRMNYASRERMTLAQMAQRGQADELRRKAADAKFKYTQEQDKLKLGLEQQRLNLARQRGQRERAKAQQDQHAKDIQTVKYISSIVGKHGKDFLDRPTIEQLKINDPAMYRLIEPDLQRFLQKGLIREAPQELPPGPWAPGQSPVLSPPSAIAPTGGGGAIDEVLRGMGG